MIQKKKRPTTSVERMFFIEYSDYNGIFLITIQLVILLFLYEYFLFFFCFDSNLITSECYGGFLVTEKKKIKNQQKLFETVMVTREVIIKKKVPNILNHSYLFIFFFLIFTY